MIFSKINIETALKKEREKIHQPQEKLLQEAKAILLDSAKGKYKPFLVKENSGSISTARILQTDPDKTFTELEIHAICSKYRLRFLSIKKFKAEIPKEAQDKIKKFEAEYGLNADYKIIAPASVFNLKDRYEDPLLMASLGNGSYYLIHKWGNDLAWYRPLLYFPFRNYSTLLASVALLSAIFSLIIPAGWLVRHEIMQPLVFYYRIFFFITCMAWISAISIYYGFVGHKNFSSEEWESDYFN